MFVVCVCVCRGLNLLQIMYGKPERERITIVCVIRKQKIKP